VSDKSPPDELRTVFGVSKKAFKRAVGVLLRERALSFDSRGFLVPTAPAD
jgi:predicted RNA-binding protein (virulence factor B family)